MKKQFVISFLLLLSFSVISQNFKNIINTDIRDYSNFYDGITYFVIDGKQEIDTVLINNLKDNWTVNEFKVISFEQIKSVEAEDAFFISLLEYTRTLVDSRTSRTLGSNRDYSIFQMILRPNYFSTRKSLCTIQLDSISSAEMIYASQLMNNMIKYVRELNVKKKLPLKRILEELSEENQDQIHDKTLLLIQSNLEPKIRTRAGLEEIYDHEFEFVEQESIDNAIIAQDDTIVYLKVVNILDLRFVFFVSAKDAEILYGKVVTGFNQLEIGSKFFHDIN